MSSVNQAVLLLLLLLKLNTVIDMKATVLHGLLRAGASSSAASALQTSGKAWGHSWKSVSQCSPRTSNSSDAEESMAVRMLGNCTLFQQAAAVSSEIHKAH